MMFYTPMLLLLGAMVPLLAGAAGVVLFIVGLVKKRTAMWGSGLVLAVVSFLIVTVGIGALFFVGVRGAQTTSRRAVARVRQAAVAAKAQEFRITFATCTGLELPPGVTVVEVALNTLAPAERTTSYMKLRTTDAFGAFLAEHFVQAAWADIRDEMTSAVARSVPFWDLSGGESMRCYRRSNPSAVGPGRTVTYVAWDTNAQTAYVVSVEPSAR